MKNLTRFFLLAVIYFTMLGGVAAQESSTIPPSSAQSGNSASNDVTPIRRKRRRAARPAEYQGAGLLQIEYGYEGDFKAKNAPDSQGITLSVNFAATDKLQLEFSNDNYVTQTDVMKTRQSGIGNTYLGFQYTAQGEKKNRPALAFAYQITLPSGSEAKGLSNGRDLHQFTGIVSKAFKNTDINFNAAYLLNGRQDLKRYDKGAQIAIGFSRNLKKNYGLQCEVFGQTLDIAQPKGIYASTTLTYQKEMRWLVDFGTNIGLTRNAPGIGIFVGITFGAVNLFKHR